MSVLGISGFLNRTAVGPFQAGLGVLLLFIASGLGRIGLQALGEIRAHAAMKRHGDAVVDRHLAPPPTEELPLRRFADFSSEADAMKAWNDAVDLIESGRPGAAVPIFRRLAENRWTGAARALGLLYRDGGPDLPRDSTEAVAWLEAAVRDEDAPDAKVDLALLKLTELEKADRTMDHACREHVIGLMREADKQGHSYALALLALWHRASTSSLHDMEAARALVRELCDRGLLIGQYLATLVSGKSGPSLMRRTRRMLIFFRARALARKDPAHPRLRGMREILEMLHDEMPTAWFDQLFFVQRESTPKRE